PHPLFFFLSCSSHHPDLHSFPTRRSSDLVAARCTRARGRRRRHRRPAPSSPSCPGRGRERNAAWSLVRGPRDRCMPWEREAAARSEEHTSELQSRSDLVCRLLLEKKKKKI